jgi:low temperature requirement protein LtrA
VGNEDTDGLPRGPGDRHPVGLLELFFDLAFVFALTQLSRKLISDLTWTGAYQTLVVLLAMWWVWTLTAWLTNRMDPRRPGVQAVVLGTMIASIVMAAVLTRAFDERAIVFASVLAALHVAVMLFLTVALPEPERRTAGRLLVWSTGTAALWLAGGLTGGTAREVLWTLGAAVDYAAFALRYPTPRLGRVSTTDWPVAAEHLAERHRQLFIIALGELILVTGLTFTRADLTADRTGAFAASILTTTLLWRIYVYRAGELLGEAIAAAADPVRLTRPVALAHLAMVADIVVTAVGDELVVTQPFGHNHPAWVAVLVGGPALFLVGRSVLEQTVFGRVSPDRPIALLLLLGFRHRCCSPRRCWPPSRLPRSSPLSSSSTPGTRRHARPNQPHRDGGGRSGLAMTSTTSCRPAGGTGAEVSWVHGSTRGGRTRPGLPDSGWSAPPVHCSAPGNGIVTGAQLTANHVCAATRTQKADPHAPAARDDHWTRASHVGEHARPQPASTHRHRARTVRNRRAAAPGRLTHHTDRTAQTRRHRRAHLVPAHPARPG